MARALLLCLALMLAAAAGAHGQPAPGGVAECEDPELNESERARTVLTIGWAEYGEARDGALPVAGRYLSCRLRRRVRVVPTSYQARLSVAERMRPTTRPKDRVDAALLTPFVYVKAKKLAPIEVFVSYRSRGRTAYNSLIVWRADSPWDTIEKLFDALLEDPRKFLACPSRNSTSGFQWPRAWLFRTRQKLLGEDVQIVETVTHNKALELLLDSGRSDVVAAAVWDGELSSFVKRTAVDPDMMFHTYPLDPAIPNDAFAYGQYLSDQDKAGLRKALLEMERDPQGKNVLESSFPDWIDGWDEAFDSSYDGVRAVSGLVSPSLRMRLATPAEYPMENLKKTLFGDGVGWFTQAKAGQLVDLEMEVTVDRVDKGLEATVSVIDQRTGALEQDEPLAESVEQLEQRIGRWMKDTFRIRGFLSEVALPGVPDGAMILRAGSGRGISTEDAAEIETPGGEVVPARIFEVLKEQSTIVPLVGKAIELDASDTKYYEAEVFPMPARPRLWVLLLMPILGGLVGGATKLLAAKGLFAGRLGLPGLTESVAHLVLGAACGAGLFAVLLAFSDSAAIAQLLDMGAGLARFGVGTLGGLIGAVVIGGGWTLARRAARRRAEPSQERLEIGVFISYRRADTAAYAGRLRDSLRERIDPHRVFMDIESIEAGRDFVDAIERALESSDVMLVLIGKDWLMPSQEGGRPRIADPDDYVGLEIATGLKSGLRIVPVLVAGASMPAPGELPEVLADLSRRNALEISDTRWDYDVGRLLDSLSGSVT